MKYNNNKPVKDPSQNDINVILKLFNSNKLSDASYEVHKQKKIFTNSPILFNINGGILASQNKLEEAIESYKKAIQSNPSYAQAYNNLGAAYHKLNKTSEAIENYEKAISLKKNFPEPLNNLGNVMKDLMQFEEALTYFKKAIEIKPDYFDAYFNIGKIYLHFEKKNEAIENFKKAIQINSSNAEVYNNIGIALDGIGKYNESILNYNKAINLNSKNEKFYHNLGRSLSEFGKHDEATKAFQKAIKIKPDYALAYSNLLFNLNFKVDFNSNFYLSVAKDFSSNCKSSNIKLPLKYSYKKNPLKLKLGLVSSDFGNHPGGFFTLSTLNELKKKNFELIAYSNFDRNDDYSRQFKSIFSKWHSIKEKEDKDVIEQILKDGIHILFDLQGHSAKNRLPLFIYKPAPIQVSWLAQGTTGIKEIDYFIGSSHIIPEIEEKNYVEKIVRLPEISQCFTVPKYDLKVNKLPAIKNKFITFGCLNKLSKINDQTISLWSKILLSIPNSKLLLKNKYFKDKDIVEEFISKFEKKDINKNRLITKGEYKTRKDLLNVYNEIDISLDPFPYQGNTTSIESIWMGVPVIVLKGDRYLSHFGESINSNLNMNDWIARNYNEYISKAIKFSSDYDYLSKLRMSLREKVLKSPIFDASLFGKNFNDVLWSMWKKFEN